MAEIRIQEKKTNWLPWLLGILALLLVGWFVLEMFEDDEDDDMASAAVVVEDDDIDDAETVEADLTNTARPQAVKAINLENFDVEWDGTNATYDDNLVYYLTSLDYLDAEMNLNHDYSNIAIRALTNSLIALAKEQGMSDEVNMKQRTETLRRLATEITEDWRSPEHADMIRKAAMLAVNAMQTIQEAKFPNLSGAIAELNQQAQQIKPGTLTLEQKENVKTFFRTAAEALEEMRDV